MVKFEEKRIIDCRSHEINFLFEEDVRKALRRTVYRGPQALEFAVWFAVESVKSVSYDPASNIVVRWGEGKTRKRYNWVHFARLLHAAFPISFSRKDSWFSRVLDSPLRFFFFFFLVYKKKQQHFRFARIISRCSFEGSNHRCWSYGKINIIVRKQRKA